MIGTNAFTGTPNASANLSRSGRLPASRIAWIPRIASAGMHML
jgi:hypothetical protein